jgi:putative aminopeptidase FrvX
VAKATEKVKPRNIKTGNWINPAPPPLNAEKVFASKEMTNRIKCSIKLNLIRLSGKI